MGFVCRIHMNSIFGCGDDTSPPCVETGRRASGNRNIVDLFKTNSVFFCRLSLEIVIFKMLCLRSKRWIQSVRHVYYFILKQHT